MIDPLELLRTKKGKPIFIQGEDYPYSELSEVSKKRLAAMYDIWLSYLEKELKDKEQ